MHNKSIYDRISCVCVCVCTCGLIIFVNAQCIINKHKTQTFTYKNNNNNNNIDHIHTIDESLIPWHIQKAQTKEQTSTAFNIFLVCMKTITSLVSANKRYSRSMGKENFIWGNRHVRYIHFCYMWLLSLKSRDVDVDGDAKGHVCVYVFVSEN